MPTFYNPVAEPGVRESIVFILISFIGGFLFENFGLFSWALPVVLICFSVRKEQSPAIGFLFETIFFLIFTVSFSGFLLEVFGIETKGGFGTAIFLNIDSQFLKFLILFFGFAFLILNLHRYESNLLFKVFFKKLKSRLTISIEKAKHFTIDVKNSIHAKSAKVFSFKANKKSEKNSENPKEDSGDLIQEFLKRPKTEPDIEEEFFRKLRRK